MTDDAQAPIILSKEEIDQLSYEDAYVHLQRVLSALDSGDLPLESSLKMYEVGTHLSAHCTHVLEEAELRVRRWQEGNSTTSFDDWNGDESN